MPYGEAVRQTRRRLTESCRFRETAEEVEGLHRLAALLVKFFATPTAGSRLVHGTASESRSRVSVQAGKAEA